MQLKSIAMAKKERVLTKNDVSSSKDLSLFGVGIQLLKSLFRNARRQDITVTNSFSCLNAIVQWDVEFVRAVHDWKVNSVSNFFENLCSVKTIQGKRRWLVVCA